tara:strand:+ start:1047 stop:1454 length:408 start_codon:yes stop_codon:yes gene_type:complete
MRKISRKGIIKKLDSIFSLYIRLRKANKLGFVECYTCGKKDHFKKMQCGHFQSRKHYSTRWEELNSQVQCYSCNVMRYGEQYKYGLKLQEEYGKELPEKLLIQSKKIVKFSNDDLLIMIDRYKQLVENIKKELYL